MNIGITHSHQKNYGRAEQYLLDSLATYSHINYPYMETIALQNISVVAYHLRQYEASESYSLTAVRLALEIEARGLAVNSLDNVARLQAHQGDYETAMMLVAFVLSSDLSNEEAKERVRQIEPGLLAAMTAEQIERARENGRATNLDTILTSIPNL
jgi:hypothetical protein